MRAVAYYRVSTVEQARGNDSIALQREKCREWAERADVEIVAEFEDAGASAKSADRPGFQAMIEYCQAYRPERVLCYALSRFSRDGYDFAVYGKLLRDFGATLVSVTEPFSDDTSGKLLSGILKVFAEHDNNARADRTKAGMIRAAERGRWVHLAPPGYLNAKSPSLVPDPERAPFIREAFDMAARGDLSREEIRRRLNAAGFRTRSGKEVSRVTFAALLGNGIYCGRVRSAFGEAKGDFEPLVPENLFGRVQAVVAGRSASTAPHAVSNPDFPLRRFVKCATCRRGITGSHSKGRGGKRFAYYSCPCGNRAPKREIESAFVNLLDRFAFTPGRVRLLKATLLRAYERRREEIVEERNAKTITLAKIEERREKLVDAFVYRQAIDAETYKTALAKLDAERAFTRCDAHDAEIDEAEIEGLLAYAEHLFASPARTWQDFSLPQRIRFQKLVFPDGLEWGREGFRPAKASQVLCFHSDGVVAHTGIEPVFRP